MFMIQNTMTAWSLGVTDLPLAPQPQRVAVSLRRAPEATMFVSPGGERAGATDPLSPHLSKLNA